MFKSRWPFFDDIMIENVTNVLKSGRVNQWTGSRVFEFERVFSEYFSVKHSVAVFNGSVALELCLKVIDLQADDEVIVTPRTFIASVSSITICNGIPIFADVDENSQNITLANIQKAATAKTKAVILVHLAGWPCDVEEIVEWCHSKNIYVIEDCAQAHGAKYNGKYVGTFGDINAWSFCQDKIMTTGGEGGMVTTNNTNLFRKAWSYKDHGKDYDKMFNSPANPPGCFRWLHDSIGSNFRMTEMQASIGIDALKHLSEWIDIRRNNAKILNDILKDLPMIRLTIPEDKYYHSYYKYYFFVNQDAKFSRLEAIKKLTDAGIPCFQGTCGEVYREKAYNLDLDMPVTRGLSATSIMLLVDPSYTPEMMYEMANIIRQTLLSLNFVELR